MRYIILDKVVYCLTHDQYEKLMDAIKKWVLKRDTRTSDLYGEEEWKGMVDEWMWIKNNVTPVSNVSDNLDLFRYDKECEKCEAEERRLDKKHGFL